MRNRRVVVTGLGVITPLGLDVVSSWDGIINGRSGITMLELFDTTGFATRFGGAVKGFNVSQYMTAKEARRMDGFIHYGIAAGTQAITHSGLEVTDQNRDRIGVAMGAGIGGITGIVEGHQNLLDGGPRKISPFFVPGNIINMLSGNFSMRYGLRGPNISAVSACATGCHNIGEAVRMVQYGDADVMVAGGAEMSTNCPTALGGFVATRALSQRNDNPQIASRPWDRDRDGFVLSDGAGVVVVEELEHALKRDAQIYAEIIGYGRSSDAYHMTQPAPGGEGGALCMRNAMRDAGVNTNELDYINAHGTSTVAGDIAETKAIKLALGDDAYSTAISSTKSMTGHMLGAAGSVEAVFSILAIKDQIIPATINLDNQDPECDLDYVPGSSRQTQVDVVMSNSFGFGGTNGTLIFRRFSG
ncbi:MAG TPA: beta-ketoacyl-[acyl-carrier-protein] synthase II [Crenotrichaceae bacterium]|nr:beta-ketoacyl-[acyl-carrier-protein] synthase II [Crenotrichaceae bacterium]